MTDDSRKMFIKVVNVDVEHVDKGNGKSYEIAEVLYDLDGVKRTQKVLSFANPTVFKTVKSATKGDTFNVTVIKNPQGFNQWNSITKSDASVSSDAASSDSGTSTRTATNTARGSTYETTEERAKRQRLIVRQSSLSNALELLTAGAKAPPDKEAVKALAEEFTDWVFEKVGVFDEPNDLEDIPY